MRRSDFSRESEITGEDFGEYISTYGGKAAGLLLAQRLLFARNGERNIFAPVFMPEHVPIRTALYQCAEEVLQERIPEPLQGYNERNPDNRFVDTDEEALLRTDISGLLLADEPFKKELERNLARCRRRFRKYSKYREAPFHVRSSTTIEDFVDDRYFGTFRTLQRERCFEKDKRGQKLPLVGHMVELIKWFYALKHHTNNYFELSVQERLGMVLMNSLPGLHVISYSSYPEIPGSPVMHEVSCVERYPAADPRPLALIEVSGESVDDVRVHPADQDEWVVQDPFAKLNGIYGARSYYEEQRPYTVNGVRSPLSLSDIGTLTALSRFLEERLGYSVNTEWKMTSDLGSSFHLLQLRPTPMIDDFKPLPPLDEEYCLIAHTPFVYGAFDCEAPLLLTEDKNVARAGITLPHQVLVWDSESRKGHRLYWGEGGGNCLALVNPEEGRTLSHERSIIPCFGPDREAFKAISVPGLQDELLEHLSRREYPLKNVEWRGRFQETSFPLRVESDGRRGRLSIHKDFERDYWK